MLKMPLLFNDGLVLQRDKKVKIWGEAHPLALIKITLQNQTFTSQALEDGQWMIECGPFHTSWKETLEISADQEKIIIEDVAIGEVWLAAGQSNMNFYMRYDSDYLKELEHLDLDVRYFDFPHLTYDEQINQANYLEKNGQWRTCTKDNLEYFSAVAYYFAKKIALHQNVPVGMIGCSWGGTVITAWMSEEAVLRGNGQEWIDDYHKAIEDLDIDEYIQWFESHPKNYKIDQFADKYIDDMLYGFTLEQQREIMKNTGNTSNMADMGPRHKNAPFVLYHAMVKKIAPYTVKGITWYQGESDAVKHQLYQTLFTSMIEDWRQLWQENLPFLFVQLAPFKEWLTDKGIDFPKIREAQQWVSEHVENTGMAVITDAGMKWDIHPKNKRPVGERLALLAQTLVYHDHINAQAPTLAKAYFNNNNLVLEFDNAVELHLNGDKINDLEIIQNQQIINDYEFKIDKNKIIISSPLFDNTKETIISIAYKDYYEINLYNEMNLPARPAKLNVH